MKFRNKIILTYTIALCLIVGTYTIMMYRTNLNNSIEREIESLRAISKVKVQQMDDIIRRAESAFVLILSDTTVLSSIRDFSVQEFDSFETMFFSEAATNIRQVIGSSYLSESFDRIIIFNQRGNVVANNLDRDGMTIDPHVSVATYPWREMIKGTGGRSILIGMHHDSWGIPNRIEVMSILKEIQGHELGFIEFQFSRERISSIMLDADTEADYIFVTSDGRYLYSDYTDIEVNHYLQFAESALGEVFDVSTPDKKQAKVFVTPSENSDFKLMTIVRKDIHGEVAREVLPYSLLLLSIGIAISFLYISITSRKLTAPIYRLKAYMDYTMLSNILDIQDLGKIPNDEIGQLFTSYHEVLKRLNTSILREERLSVMQLQAQFDSLQAQVNPHFIFNVLNVISNRGVISGDNVICEVCSELAGMLRYSTNTKDKCATVKQEVEYLELYLSLLKRRYDYKLDYHISIDDALQSKLLPKIVLQQLVENSINHGFGANINFIRIELVGEVNETGWVIKIIDNGAGILQEKIDEIKQSMEEIKRRLSSHRQHVEMEIGGMGLINTFARLFILYKDALLFEIASDPSIGTVISISILE